MADIDDFATALLEEAKRFYEKAREAAEPVAHNANIHAAMMLAFSSLEAHLNAISEEFAERPEFTLDEKGLLLEREVKLDGGAFVLGGQRIWSIADRISFLHRKFTGAPIGQDAVWWGQLGEAIKNRNRLTHPKGPHPIEIDDVRDALTAIIGALDALYRAIYKKSFPAAGRGLQSQLNF